MECCGTGLSLKSLSEKYDVKVSETEKGIAMEIEPKDKSKVKQFKAFIKASQDYCDCGCC
jgi:hypothetical protein